MFGIRSKLGCWLVANVALVVASTCAWGQAMIPGTPDDAVEWLQNTGNQVKRNALGQVEEVTIDYVPDVFVLGDLEVFPHLKSLRVNYTRSFRDYHMSGIARLKQLRSIYVYRCRGITEASLAVLRYVPTLESLELVNCDSIRSLVVLNRCRNLKHLKLADQRQFDFDELERLTFVRQLESFQIRGCSGFENKHVELLAQAKNMSRLSLVDCGEVTDEGLQKLGALKQLTDLELRFIPNLEGQFLNSINAGLKKFSATQVGMLPDSVSLLGRFRQLESLVLTNAFKEDPTDWSALAACRALKVLCLPNSEIADEHLRAMADCTQLEYLKLNWCAKVSGTGLAALHGASGLRTLNLNGCRRIDSADLPILSGFPNLRSLDLSETRVRTENIESLTQLTRLAQLSLNGCKWIGDEAIEKISRIESLKELNLENIARVTDNSLKSLARLKGLRKLVLTGNRKVTGEGFAKFDSTNLLSQLKLLDVEAVSPAGMACLLNLTKLKHLEVRSKSFSNEHVLALRGHPSLSYFDFENMENIDDTIYRRFLNSLPNYR